MGFCVAKDEQPPGADELHQAIHCRRDSRDGRELARRCHRSSCESNESILSVQEAGPMQQRIIHQISGRLSHHSKHPRRKFAIIVFPPIGRLYAIILLFSSLLNGFALIARKINLLWFTSNELLLSGLIVAVNPFWPLWTIFLRLDEEYRPVKIKKIVLGYNFSKTTSDYGFDLNLNYKLADIISSYSQAKPTLIVNRAPFWMFLVFNAIRASTLCVQMFESSSAHREKEPNKPRPCLLNQTKLITSRTEDNISSCTTKPNNSKTPSSANWSPTSRSATTTPDLTRTTDGSLSGSSWTRSFSSWVSTASKFSVHYWSIIQIIFKNQCVRALWR